MLWAYVVGIILLILLWFADFIVCLQFLRSSASYWLTIHRNQLMRSYFVFWTRCYCLRNTTEEGLSWLEKHFDLSNKYLQVLFALTAYCDNVQSLGFWEFVRCVKPIYSSIGRVKELAHEVDERFLAGDYDGLERKLNEFAAYIDRQSPSGRVFKNRLEDSK